MEILRKPFLILIGVTLNTLLLAFGIAFSLFQVFSTPTHLKASLHDSDVYSAFVSDVLASSNTATVPGTPTNQLPVDQPEVQKIIKESFDPVFLENQTNGVIDGVYGWLRGDTKLDFTIDLTEPKAKLVAGIGAYVDQRLAALPTCTVPTDTSAILNDPYNASCLPPGFNRQVAVQKAQQDIANNPDFLSDPVISASSLKDANGRSLSDILKNAPTVYNVIRNMVFGTLILIVASIVAIIFVSSTRLRGLQRTSLIFIANGFITTLFAFATATLGSRLVNAITANSGSEKGFSVRLAEILRLLLDRVGAWWLGYSLVVLLVGVTALVVARVLIRKQKFLEVENNFGKPEHPTPETPLIQG